MFEQRTTDSQEMKSKFRSSRMLHEAGKWYYATREGTVEGPFDSELEASGSLYDYIKVVTSGLLQDAGELALQPLNSRTSVY